MPLLNKLKSLSQVTKKSQAVKKNNKMVKVALLIGVSEHEPGLTPLPATIKDVDAMQQVLQNPEIGGFDRVTQLINPQRQAMEEAIETLFDGRQKDDLVLLFFSGHGIKDESGKLYFATRNTRKNLQGKFIETTTVAASSVHKFMTNSRSKHQVVILDCCFSGAFVEGMAAKDNGCVDIKNQLGGEGRAVLTSSTSTECSFEQQGADTSTYTRYIVEGLQTGAADRDEDGWISVHELHEYATKAVQEATPAMKPEIYAIKEGFKILLSKAPIGDPKLRYHKEVEIYASRGEISFFSRIILDALRQNLGLLPEETAAIEAEVLKPYREYQEKLQQYKQVLVDVIGREQTLSDYTRNDFRRYQEILGLRDEDIASIEETLIAGEAPPSVQPHHRVEIPSQPGFSSSNPTTTPKTHNPILKVLRRVIAVLCFFCGVIWVIGGLFNLAPADNVSRIGYVICGILSIWLGIFLWKL